MRKGISNSLTNCGNSEAAEVSTEFNLSHSYLKTYDILRILTYATEGLLAGAQRTLQQEDQQRSRVVVLNTGCALKSPWKLSELLMLEPIPEILIQRL